MAEFTSGHAEDNPSTPLPEIPEIPECDTSRDDDGTIRVRHKRTGDTETATTVQDAEMKGMVLRVSAAIGKEIPFTAGDMP
ncbi:hypothetical protein [Nonomuraea roseoviolacea]|uniref:Uncharacterized protein n=1 Tax=Nonomuraea roseoviolacea subsp. carminata TaxID=160689 RepID=A0ABT1K9A2_9ACTN|nr:hypothetical protein [Nonomuraea roseoviolacea]MCP2350597.1 hypothetical protein [Nonomuraea roseoviolacea subsp. carminata]